MSILLGCVADDFTGATDLANTLVKQGLNVIQLFGVPEKNFEISGAVNAVVVALKTRSISADSAVSQSLQALDWLRARDTRQYYFKYCSTFDSTEKGNIGPVADAMMDALGVDYTIFNPAFPTTGRTVYKGYLFVGDQLLSESGMKDHPLNPMTDPNLCRVLRKQSKYSVSNLDLDVIRLGSGEIKSALKEISRSGARHVVTDTTNDQDLLVLGEALSDLKLVTGGSGMAMGLPQNFEKEGLLKRANNQKLIADSGNSLILAGSCSNATRGQIKYFQKQGDSFQIDPIKIFSESNYLDQVVSWAKSKLGNIPILIYSSADPDELENAKRQASGENLGLLVEDFMGQLAKALVRLHVTKIIVAGGETSGAVVNALGIQGLLIGGEIDPGVPWTQSLNHPQIMLALKSGNFGREDFFVRAFKEID